MLKVPDSFSNALPASFPESTGQFAIAIPAFNEERFIGSVVIQARRYSQQVVVIDDGSHDQTAYIARLAGAIVFSHPTNQGKSQALNTAMRWACQNSVNALVFIDGDGQHRPDEINQVVAPVLDGKADMVIGSRFLSVRSNIPAYRKVGQHLLTSATNFASAVNVTDSQSGFRAFSRRAVEVMQFTGEGLSVESEMQFQAKEHQLQVLEVPISVIYHEKAKRSPIGHGLQIVSNLVKLVGQHRPLFFFGVPGLVCLAVGLSIGFWVIDIYSRTHTLAIGYTLLAVLLTLLGILAVFVGVILHSVRAFFLDLKKLVNLNSQNYQPNQKSEGAGN